jgi:hypothetical protein
VVVLAPEGLVDVEEHLLLALRQAGIGQYGVGDGARRSFLEDPRLHVQGLRGDPQTFRDLLQDLGGRLAQAPFDLAEVRVADAGHACELAK